MSAFAFGDFVVDAAARRITRGGVGVAIPDRHVGVLLQLIAQAGSVVSKDALIESAWGGLAVTDNSLEQAISGLRKAIGDAPDGTPYIQTVPRQGYRFTGTVTRTTARASDEALDALLAPHRAWIEGRAALETLEGGRILSARAAFEHVLRGAPDQASAHVGMANACALQFEMSRTDASPDVEALALAARHAREACRLAPDYGEAWATLGFVLNRTGHPADALAASRRAVTLEPDHWRHHLRLAYASWGEERLREAHRTLALLPGFPLAHWLCASVHVARQALDEAERELEAGIAGQPGQPSGPSRFSSVALYWLRGLLHLARGRDRLALDCFERELAAEASGHLYARECCANTWYAIGALHRRRGRTVDATSAFQEALARVPTHALATLGLGGVTQAVLPAPTVASAPSFDAVFARAVRLAVSGAEAGAARLLDQALAEAPAGNAGWLLPVEPLLDVAAAAEVWAPALARLRARAA